VLPADEQLARWLRREVLGGSSGGSASSEPASGNPAGGGCALLLAANKCERRGGGEGAVAAALAESMRLGLGEPVALSAMTGEGMTELYAALQPLLDPLIETRQAAVQQLVAGRDGEAEERAGGVGGGQLQAGSGAPEGGSSSSGSGSSSGTSGGGGPLKIAIMGLPNVGKSTLTNWLLQEERCLTGPEPGLTRDAVRGLLSWRGRQVELVDTAGWIRRTQLARYDESGARAELGWLLHSGHGSHTTKMFERWGEVSCFACLACAGRGAGRSLGMHAGCRRSARGGGLRPMLFTPAAASHQGHHPN
jgi:hypothetical protein